MSEIPESVVNPTELVEWAVETYEKPLMAYAVSLLRDVESSRDVVQETFFKLHQQEPGKVRNALKSWLFTVCRNRALDVLKKDRRMTSVEAPVLEAVSEERPGPAELTIRHERHREVMGLLAELPKNRREVLRLRFQNDLSYREISEITGFTVSHVGVLMHTGLKQLKMKMEERSSKP